MSAPFDTPNINANVEFETKSLRFNNVHKLWGMIELLPQNCQTFDGFDLVVAFDISASMHSHLEMINWIFRFILDPLNENHTLTLITFNHKATVYTNCVPCTKENKSQINKIFSEIKCGGSTDILDCLSAGTKVLKQKIQKRPSAFAIFTDGCQHFISPENILTELKKLDVPCPVYTFGFSRSQDSGLLHAIAHQTCGVYQNIQTSDQVPMIINSFMNSLHNICAMDICVTFKCYDGARLITLATPYKIEEKNIAKEYTVTIPTISKNHSKTILFRLSLRKMDAQMEEHTLITMNVSAVYPNQGQIITQYGPYLIARPAMALLEKMPIILDNKLIRYTTAISITEAIDAAEKHNFVEATDKLNKTIVSIGNSESPITKLISDLNECIKYVKDYQTFIHGGAHAARMIASEYFMEYERTIPLRWSYPTPQHTYIFALAYGENS